MQNKISTRFQGLCISIPYIGQIKVNHQDWYLHFIEWQSAFHCYCIYALINKRDLSSLSKVHFISYYFAGTYFANWCCRLEYRYSESEALHKLLY
jgi:hypothetical protein